MQWLQPNEFKRRQDQKMFFLCFSYKIPTNKFNMTREQSTVYIFLHTPTKTPICGHYRGCQEQPLREGLAAGGMMGDAGAWVVV